MTNSFEPYVGELSRYNADYAQDFHDAERQVEPGRQLAIVSCMDSRIDISKVLGLDVGEAHIIRNAGGVITDDVIRSLCLSQRMLGTREIIVVHHTDCGLQKVDEIAFRDQLETELGVKPSWSLEAFADPFLDTRQSMERLRRTPFLLHKDHITGYVYDVSDGLLKKVVPVVPGTGE